MIKTSCPLSSFLALTKISEDLRSCSKASPDASEVYKMTVRPLREKADVDGLPVEIKGCSLIDETTFQLQLYRNGKPLLGFLPFLVFAFIDA